MKVYLDTDMVSSIARGDMPGDVEGALVQLLELKDAGSLELVTSEVALREIESYKGKDKRILRIVYFLLEKVRPAPTEQWGTGLSPMGTPMGRTYADPIYSHIRLILDEKDASHIFQAIKNSVNVFLTLDGGILARKGEIKGWHMDVLKPNELLERLGSKNE